MGQAEGASIIADYIVQLRRFDRDVRLFLLAAGIVGLTVMDGIYPVLFNLYLLRLGFGPEYIGMVSSVGLLGYAVFAFPAGMIARMWGIRRSMIAGLSITTLFYAFLPLGEGLSCAARDVYIPAVRLGGSLGMALYYVNAIPYLMNVTHPSRRNLANSVRLAMGSLAGFVGSLVGGALPRFLSVALDVPLDQPAPYRYPLIFGAALCALAVWALAATRDGAGPQRTAARPTRTEPRTIQPGYAVVPLIVVTSVISMFRTTGIGASRTFFNVYMDDGLGVSTARIGALFAAIQLISLPVTLAMPWVAQRFGQFTSIIGSSLGIAASLVPMALLPNWVAATLGRFGAYAFSGISDPALGVYQMELVPEDWRPTMSGAGGMLLGVSWAAVSLGGGFIIAKWGYPSLFLTAAALTTLGTLLFWAFFRRPRGEYARGAVVIDAE